MVEPRLIGVVTVTFNSAEVLTPFLACLKEQTHERFLLIAVDNASKDASVAMLQAWPDERCRVIANPDNRGVAEANNQGIDEALQAGCSHVLLLNNDVEFGPTLFEQLLQGLATSKAQLSCPKMMYYDEPDRIWAAGGKFLPYAGYRSVHIGEGDVDRGQYDEQRYITYVPTCCVLVERDVFDRVGLMDSRYFVYVDDTDFMYRVMRAGLLMVYLPKATLLHKVGRLTGGEESAFSIRHGTRNRLFFLFKHFGVLLSLPWLGICLVTWTGLYLTGSRSRSWFKLKQDAMREALSMWRRQSQ